MLKTKFYILCKKFTKNTKLIDLLWKEIELEYSNNRYYHSLKHLCSIYQELQTFKLSTIIEFTIFYHDIVYDINKSNNEEKSAILAKKNLLKIDVPNEIINQVMQLIIESKSHHTIFNSHKKFLDADLHILGSKSDIYQEYQKYSDNQYNYGRKLVLESILKKDKIYNSDFFYQKYERKARENLLNEYKKLLS